ncbi:MAG: hypothetical protein AAF490_08820 [Chloroflexota bacterium]
MSQVHQLYKLQQIDSEIQEKKKRLGEVLKLQKGNPALIAARGRLETAVANHQKWQASQKDKNLELASLTDKRQKSEKRLYSGNVTNPKELSDLQDEIESLGRRVDALEEEILEVMLYLEEAESEETDSHTEVDKLEEAWANETVDLKQEQNELALRLHHLLESRKAHLPTVKPDALKEYTELSKKKGGVAVSRVRVNRCLSCQIVISDQIVKNAKAGNIVNCAGCGRIIYVV